MGELKVDLRPANLRDASFVTANLRHIDRDEAFCQLPDGCTTIELAYGLLHAGQTFIAYLDDNAVAIYGTSQISASCYSVYALGTDRMHRAIPAISRHFMVELVEHRIAQGARTMEARSLASHETAHRWMKSLGAVQHCGPFPYGKADEPFVLFRWTVAGYRAIREKRWSAR